jgi:SAM-dependent methyltransferase
MGEILNHYGALYQEEHRLQSGLGALEFARTQEIVLRRLPAPPQRILDSGGGPGVYSAWLAGLGYEVHLVDLTPRHVEQARRISGLATAKVGDARRLGHADESMDAVLLMGPMYHLTERVERLSALRETRRVLRSGGLLYAAAISRFASLLDGLHTLAIDDPAFLSIVERDLDDGQHRNDTGNPAYFTTAFFHHPEELGREIEDAGLELLELLAVEGPVWIARDFEARWGDPVRREQLLRLARNVEAEPSLLGASPHLLAVARR